MVEGNFAHRRLLQVRRVVLQTKKLVLGVEQQAVIDFGKVMVLARQPENRHSRQTFLGQFFRQLHRGQRLIDAVGRPAKQPHLLAGDDGQGVGPAQPLDIFLAAGIAAELAILLCQYVGHGGACFARQRHLLRGGLKALRSKGVVTVKARHPVKTIEVIGKERGCVRNLCERNTVGFHGSGHLSPQA